MDMISLRRNLIASNLINLAEYTVTGNPVAFTTQIAKPVKSVAVPLSYTQEGSGDPSLSNVRPITGISSFTFTHNNSSIDVVFPALGKNLCPPPVKGVGVDGSDGHETTSATRATTDYIPVDFATNPNYKFSGMPNTLTMWVSGYNANKEFVGRTSSDKRLAYTISSDKFNQGQPTHTEDVAFVRLTFSAGSGASIDDVDSASIQLEVSNTTTEYEPYCNTVYGGSLDLVSGVLTIDNISATFKISDYTYKTAYTDITFYDFRHVLNKPVINNNHQICSIAKYSWNGETRKDDHFYIYTMNGSPRLMLYLVGTVDETQEFTVVAPVETPFTIQLDPHSITAIKGANTIWTDTTGDLTIKYLNKA